MWVWVFMCMCLGVGLSNGNSPFQWRHYPDYTGPYCRTRTPEQCCTSRYDPCSVPIDGTLCYCDQFCDRGKSSDCCPDYLEVCKGIRPPVANILNCRTQDGRTVPYNYQYMENCNECKCVNGLITCGEDLCMVDNNIINRINRSPVGWRAANHTMFWGRKASEGFQRRTGTFIPETLSQRMYPIMLRPGRLPREFDSRTKYEWRDSISGVMDQGWCGASWAFSTLGVAQDRIAIETQGEVKVSLSAQHLVSCDSDQGQGGCKGGHMEFAWQYLRQIGTVEDSCFPFTSGDNGEVPSCPTMGRRRTQSLRCVGNQEVKYRNDFYRVEPSYRISGDEEDIQWEIMQNGPVQAIMKVYRDFFSYRDGIYTHTVMEGDSSHAQHSVRILGWGEDRGVKYWLCANSWGREWGENGYFRIRRGTNESNIETFVLAVRANLNGGKLMEYRRRGRYGSRRGRRARNHVNSLDRKAKK